MIRVTPFTFKHTTFLKGERKSSLCLELSQELNFEDRGLVLISGRSGSGKSTLLNIIKGLIPFHIIGEFDGEVWIDNIKLTRENVESFNQKIVYLFQNPFSQLIHQDPTLEMAFTLENLNTPADQFQNIKNEIVKKLGLEGRLNVLTSQLSTGECQKLVLGSLIALGPQVLLLDEPTAFLDPKARENFYSILSELKKNHLIILVDHHVEEVASLVDKYLIVHDKKIYTSDKEIQKLPTCDDEMNLNFKPMKERIEFQINNLSYSYDGQRSLLKNINLNAQGGDCVVFKGENGQGKSTLFKIMSGIIPTKNSIQFKINNQTIETKKILKHAGFVFQNPESNFLFNTLGEEVSKDHNRELVKMFFAEEDLDRSPYLFSEGQKRRISILINLALNKKILFLDEPTFGQDERNKKNIIEIVNNLKKMGLLLFIISHDDKFINAVSDVVYVLNNGILNEVK